MVSKLKNLILSYKKLSITLLVIASIALGQFGLHLGNFLPYGDRNAFKFVDPLMCMSLGPVAQAVMQAKEFGVPKIILMSKLKEWLSENPKNVQKRILHFASEVYDGRGDMAFTECVEEGLAAIEKAARSKDPRV